VKVTIFAKVDTGLNPYLLLFEKALVHQGLAVDLEQEFNLRWLLSRGKSSDCLHFQWIGAAYSPKKRNLRSGFLNKLLSSVLVKGLLSGIGLAGFATALVLARMQGKIVVYTVHNLETIRPKRPGAALLNRLAHYVLMALSDRIHVHNQYSQDLINTKYKRKGVITVIPHGNYIGYYPNKISKSEARHQLGLPTDAFVYLFFGLIRPYKGIENLIEAFSELESPDARLLIAGKIYENGDYGRKLESLSRHNAAIKLVPQFIPDEAVQIYMNASDVSVLPYRHITTSGAAALALSFGRPVIAPAITSFPELITAESGILYDPDECDSLGKALRQAKDCAWSESQILDYAHQFDWRNLGSQLLALYEER
jgi:glycosyltransferase involved in cell wall biosynthesis